MHVMQVFDIMNQLTHYNTDNLLCSGTES